MSRRMFGGSLLAGTGALAVRRMLSEGSVRDRRRPRSRVAILRENSYAGPLDRVLMEGLRLFDLDLGGKSVLLKPNLVEYIPGAEVNTNPRLVGAAATAFLALGAKTVLVGEGPGHQRDTALDHRSLNIDTFNSIYVLMGHALPEEAPARPVQRGRDVQTGGHPQVSN